MKRSDRDFLIDYAARLARLIEPDDELIRQIGQTRDLWLQTEASGGKVMFLGNGGSAGISSHLAIDLAKNAHVTAICFNDAGLITCLANDHGHDNWMSSAVRIFGRSPDTLVAISSSGRSKNVLNAVAMARETGMKVVTLSGMAADNPLRGTGDINFWADSRAYNIIESAHQFWMMAAIDLIIGRAEYSSSDAAMAERTAL
jgi:D-sedoheptulose 7-phosphate isomerase